MPDALAHVNCYLSVSAASADATFLETFAAACPSQCWSECPDESCENYSDDSYTCHCGDHVISTEEECTITLLVQLVPCGTFCVYILRDWERSKPPAFVLVLLEVLAVRYNQLDRSNNFSFRERR